MKTVSLLLLLFSAAPAAARVPDPAECVDTFNIGRSVACYTEIINSFSGRTPADHKALMYHYRALLYVNWDKPEKALSDYTKAIALDTGSAKSPNAGARLVCERAGVYGRLARNEKALADYRACLAAGNDWADEGAGEALLKLGDARGAISHLSRALTKGPGYGYIYLKRAEAYRLSGENGKAAADAESAVALDQADTDALYLLAKARLNSGDPRGALDYLARLEKLTGPNNEYASYRGLASHLLGKRAEAEQFFREAVEAHTGSKEAELNTACYWWGIKRNAAKARETLEKHGALKGAPAAMPALAECLKGLP